MDGFELVKQIKGKPELAQVPIVFLSNQKSIDDKIKGLQLGVEDYLTKPIFVRELITRINMLLARRTHDRIAQESAPSSSRTRFAGSLEDMGVVDLLQTLDVSRKTGVLRVRSGKYQATVYLQEGQLVDAEMGALSGEEAVYRILTWHFGEFEVEIKTVTRENVVNKPLQTLLMEGMRRVDEWSRLTKGLPELTAVVAVNERALAERLSEIPEELQGILRLLNGQYSLLDVVDESPFDDLSTLTVLAKLHDEGVLIAAGHPALDAHAVVPRSSAPPLSFAWGRANGGAAAVESAAVSVPYENELRADHLRAPAVPMGFVHGADYGTPAHGMAAAERVSAWPTASSPDELDAALAQGLSSSDDQSRQRRSRGWVLAALILALGVLLFASLRTLRQSGDLADRGMPRAVDTSVAPALAASPAPVSSIAPVASAAPSASAEPPRDRPRKKGKGGIATVPSAPARPPNGLTPTAVFPEDEE
jgi:hypothetical protein